MDYKFTKIGFGTPLKGKVLLYWKNSQHIEDGELFLDEGNLYHKLFDGESLNDQPTHWCYLPEVED